MNRRLTTDHELRVLKQMKQRYQRAGAAQPQLPSTATLSNVFEQPLNVEVNPEMMRFGTEDLLTFKSLLACPLPVRDDYDEVCHQEVTKVRT